MSNFKKSAIALFTGITIFLIFNLVSALPVNHVPSVTVPSTPLPEHGDYATLVWGDPWDMSEYSDVSQYMNESGQRDVVRNIDVSNGIFSATSAGPVAGSPKQNGWFFTLFPGYRTAVHTGRTGSMKPISSSQYQCFYIAMKVNSVKAGDQYRIFWFGDERLNAGGTFGFTNGIKLYPEYGGVPVPAWKLYKIDIPNTAMPSEVSGLTPWNGLSSWQGLRIDPTINANTNYAVDWVRLTDCAPQTTHITFSSDNSINSVWIRPQGETRHILVATGVNGASGSYNLDIQGIQPGAYRVGFGDEFSCCVTESSGVITVNQTPIVQFVNPTLYSGQDFATSQGNAWDMDSSADFSGIGCATYGVSQGKLWLNTPPNWAQPPECVGAPPQKVADPNINLNANTSANPAEYRYLSYHMNEVYDWQFVAQGSINRWIWIVQGSSGVLGSKCYLVSNDLPHDVGWHTYTIDLWDAFAGSAEAWVGDCGGLSTNWKQSSPILEFRIDPNENISDHSFYNEFDWIRLTKPIVIQKGQLFLISLDKFFPNDSFNVNLYYTTKPQNKPKQHPVVIYSPPSPGTPGPNAAYLPIIKNGLLDPILMGGDLEYQWDTSSVSPGEYYICAEVFDNYNQAMFCSEATITVTK